MKVNLLAVVELCSQYKLKHYYFENMIIKSIEKLSNFKQAH